MGFEPVQVEFLPEANSEVLHIQGNYELKRAGLGEQFANRINEVIERISRQPEGGRDMEHGVRRVVVRQFPYLLFYLYQTELLKIVVLGVRHERGDPKNWPEL